MNGTTTTVLTVKIEAIPDASRWDPLAIRWRWEVRGPIAAEFLPYPHIADRWDERLDYGDAVSRASARRQARRACRRIWLRQQRARHTETWTYTATTDP